MRKMQRNSSVRPKSDRHLKSANEHSCNIRVKPAMKEPLRNLRWHEICSSMQSRQHRGGSGQSKGGKEIGMQPVLDEAMLPLKIQADRISL